MTNYLIKKIISSVERVVRESEVSINRKLFERAGEESDESGLISLLNEINAQAIKNFDDATSHSFPKSYDFRASFHDYIIVANSSHPLSIFYAPQVDEERSVKKQIRDYNDLMKQGYKKLGLPNSTIEKVVLQGEAAILQDLIQRAI